MIQMEAHQQSVHYIKKMLHYVMEKFSLPPYHFTVGTSSVKLESLFNDPLYDVSIADLLPDIDDPLPGISLDDPLPNLGLQFSSLNEEDY